MTIAESPSTSLFSLALESQAIDGELAIALAKLESEDPEEQATAEQLISNLLERAGQAHGLIEQKANAICFVREAMLGKAKYLRDTAAARIERAEAEERNAERLLSYLTTTLAKLHPGQKKFSLPEYTLASRASEAIEIDGDSFEACASNPYCRTEIRIKLSAGQKQIEAADNLAATAIELLRDLAELDAGDFDLTVTHAPDKAAIKDAIKGAMVSAVASCTPGLEASAAAQAAATAVPGACLVKRTTWGVK
jgi:hypothetical protein